MKDKYIVQEREYFGGYGDEDEERTRMRRYGDEDEVRMRMR